MNRDEEMRLRPNIGWLLEDDPCWYHASVDETQVNVPDGLLEQALERLVQAGFTNLVEPAFVDFAPGVIVDEYEYCHARKHRLYHCVRKGKMHIILLSPIRKRYLTCGLEFPNHW